MFGNAFSASRRIKVAAVVVAFVFFGCGDSPVGPGGGGTPTSPVVLIASMIDGGGKLVYNGQEANGTAMWNSSIEVQATAFYNGEFLAGSSIKYYHNNQLVDTGDAVFITPVLGNNCVRAEVSVGSGGQNEACFPVREDGGETSIIRPLNGEAFAFGEAVPCSVTVALDPPRGFPDSTIWKLDGRATSCNGTMPQSTTGTHQAIATTTYEGSALVTVDTVSFTVEGKPWLVSYTRDIVSSWEFFVMNRDNGLVEQLTNSGGWKRDAAVSPDGTMIAYTLASPEKSSCPDLWVANRDGSNSRALTRNCEAGGVDRPYWFPNGRKIAFSAGQPGSSGGVGNWTINTDGTGLHLVHTYTCPQFVFVGCVAGASNGVLPHAEGLIMSYTTWDGNGVGQYILTLVRESDGQEIRRLYEVSIEASRQGFILQPYDISPDGSMITVMSVFEDKAYVIKTDGSNMSVEPLSLSTTATVAFFCGDSNWIYYRFYGELWRMNLGSGETVLHTTNSQGHTLTSARCVPQK